MLSYGLNQLLFIRRCYIPGYERSHNDREGEEYKMGRESVSAALWTSMTTTLVELLGIESKNPIKVQFNGMDGTGT